MLLANELPKAGAKWAKLREESGYTRLELAAMTGLDVGTVRRLETTGRVNASTRKLVAAALRVPVFEEAVA